MMECGCGRTSVGKRVRCPVHQAARVEKDRAIAAERTAKGLCTLCEALAETGFKLCQLCRTSRLKKLHSRTKRGLCKRCDTPLPSIEGYCSTYCQECVYRVAWVRIFKRVKGYEALVQLLKSQGGKCPYTGEQLVLGLNAALDHRNPASRFPEEAKSLSNFQWIHKSVNSMKSDLTEEEFFALMKRILTYVNTKD